MEEIQIKISQNESDLFHQRIFLLSNNFVDSTGSARSGRVEHRWSRADFRTAIVRDMAEEDALSDGDVLEWKGSTTETSCLLVLSGSVTDDLR